MENGCRITRTTINIGPKVLTSVTRRDPDADTLWTIEHLLKSNQDVEAYLQLPNEFFSENINISPLIEFMKHIFFGNHHRVF